MRAHAPRLTRADAGVLIAALEDFAGSQFRARSGNWDDCLETAVRRRLMGAAYVAVGHNPRGKGHPPLPQQYEVERRIGGWLGRVVFRWIEHAPKSTGRDFDARLAHARHVGELGMFVDALVIMIAHELRTQETPRVFVTAWRGRNVSR